MDFMRILRSLEEFLYEVMTWLVFYPRTLLRTALRPISMLEYSRAELSKPEEEQYQDSLSAPLFLILTLVISHGIELALHLHPFKDRGHAADALFGSDQNLIMLRALMFAVFPLMYALEQVRDSKLPLTRKTLRGPFFGECYAASIFCLAFGLGGTIAQAWPERGAIGGALMVASAAWYLVLQTVWLRRFNPTWTKAVLVASACFLKAAAIVVATATALALAVLV